MRKAALHILWIVMLLGTLISQSHAAADESGNNTTAPSSDEDTLPPEPGSETPPPSNPTPSIDSESPAGEESPADTTSTANGPGKAAGKGAAKASVYKGKYFGGKFGIINSRIGGAVTVPKASTFVYGLQGGYIQGGYNWDLHILIAGVGAYLDWNDYTIHSNFVGYGSRDYGLDIKLGMPVNDWLLYIKRGYGRSMVTGNTSLNSVEQYGSNIAVGAEYNFAPRWSAIAEYKIDRFSNRDGSITVNNKLFAFGLNYYFDTPLKAKKAKKAEAADIPIPPPILQPDALPEAPPPP